MTIEVVRDLQQLHRIEPEWTSLVRSDPTSTPFQLPVWLITWWSHFGSGCLHVMVFREGEQIVGVIPAFLHEWQNRRQLTLLGSGVSDYLDPVITPSHAPEVTSSLDQHLESNTEWDICDWQDLSIETPLRHLTGTAIQDDTPRTEVSLTGSFDQFWSRFSKDLRRNIRRYSERARQQGTLAFNASADQSALHLDELIRLHTARWQNQGEPGMIKLNRSEAFLRDVIEQLSEIGLIRFFTLTFQEKLAALILSFPYNNRIFAYMTGFDPEFESLGVGRILLFEAMKHSQEQGYATWDFLRGDEPYKSLWGAESKPRCRLTLHRAS